MKDWKEPLHDGDPLRTEPELPPADVDRMRRAMIAAARERTSSPRVTWQALAAAVIATVAIIVVARRTPFGEAGAPTLVDRASAVPVQAPSLRQVQFATPGGTRVIWTFNEDFEVRSR